MGNIRILSILLALLAISASAIDSDLVAKSEKRREDKAKRKETRATFKLTSGEKIRCNWLARVGDEYRYERHDGKLFTTPAKDVSNVTGEVLAATPATEVKVHVMYCNGGYCKPTVQTIHVPAWPNR